MDTTKTTIAPEPQPEETPPPPVTCKMFFDDSLYQSVSLHPAIFKGKQVLEYKTHKWTESNPTLAKFVFSINKTPVTLKSQIDFTTNKTGKYLPEFDGTVYFVVTKIHSKRNSAPVWKATLTYQAGRGDF